MNTFTGSTSIQQGTLAIASADAVANSASISLSPGTVFDAKSLPGGYTVAEGQTISGTGTILGSITFGRGSTLSTGMLSGANGFTEAVAVPEPVKWSLLVVWLTGFLCRRRFSAKLP